MCQGSGGNSSSNYNKSAGKGRSRSINNSEPQSSHRVAAKVSANRLEIKNDPRTNLQRRRKDDTDASVTNHASTSGAETGGTLAATKNQKTNGNVQQPRRVGYYRIVHNDYRGIDRG